MKNASNLKPFQPGQSGNPAGRPAGSPNRATVARKWLDVTAKVTNPETKEVETGTLEDRVILGLIGRAMKGDPVAFRELMDSVYGKNPTVLTGANGSPLLSAGPPDLSSLSVEELQLYIELARKTRPTPPDDGTGV